jgi:GNAT superfamily N-acetyltransferase
VANSFAHACLCAFQTPCARSAVTPPTAPVWDPRAVTTERFVLPMRGKLWSVAAPTKAAPEYTMRHAARADVDALGRLMTTAYRGTVDDGGESPEWHDAEARSTLDGGYGRVIWTASFVVPRNDRSDLVAASIVTLDRDLLLLAFLLVHPEQQAQGVGTTLLAHSASALRAEGHTEWTLAVTRGNPAIHLYERAGFKVDESLRRR